MCCACVVLCCGMEAPHVRVAVACDVTISRRHVSCLFCFVLCFSFLLWVGCCSPHTASVRHPRPEEEVQHQNQEQPVSGACALWLMLCVCFVVGGCACPTGAACGCGACSPNPHLTPRPRACTSIHRPNAHHPCDRPPLPPHLPHLPRRRVAPQAGELTLTRSTILLPRPLRPPPHNLRPCQLPQLLCQPLLALVTCLDLALCLLHHVRVL